jgi:hypothetical protein
MCVEWALLLHLLLLACEQGVDGCVELVAALEEVELEDEDVARDGAAEFLHECAGCRCRAACSMESASCTAHCLRVYLPVAMMSSTISTFCPGLIASACIWKKSLPYSFWYSAVSQGPGSLPRFLTGTNAAPSLNASEGPNRKPRASRPTTTSGLPALANCFSTAIWSARTRPGLRKWAGCPQTECRARGNRGIGAATT